jgi:uncharacterized damage-inducible protein DinB
MNPYASFLGGREPRAVISDTSAKLAAHVERLGPEGLKQPPAPGKWSATAILCHLADCELVFAFRLRQALAEPYHVIQPFDQDTWAKPYETADPRLALEMFDVTRRWNLALLARLAPADFSKKLTHPERGEMTFQTVVETMAGHDLNHLLQLDRIS